MRLFAPLLFVCLLQAQPPEILTLRQAMDQAAQLNPEIQLANLRWLESKAATRIAAAAYKPQLSATAVSAYQTINLQGIGLFFPGMDARVGPFQTFNARPSASQTVLDLSLLSRIRAARERESELQFDRETAREATLLAVVQLYLQIQQAESRIRAAQARLSTATALLQQTVEFNDVGTASKLDVARARQQQHAEQTNVTLAIQTRDELTVLLARTIGLPPGSRLHLEPLSSLSAPGESSIATAVEQRPEIRASDARTRVAEQERLAASRQRLPKVGLMGDFGVLGASPANNTSTYLVGVSVSVPIWTGGRIQAETEAARLRVEQLRAQRKSLELRVAQEVEQARIGIAAAGKAMQSARDAAAAAREALELSRLRFGAGIATSVDTTVAQGVLAEAEDAEIRAGYEMEIAKARLAYAVGNVYGIVER